MGGGIERTVAGLFDVWGAILRAVFCRRGPALFTVCSFGVGARYRDNVIIEGLHVIRGMVVCQRISLAYVALIVGYFSTSRLGGAIG